VNSRSLAERERPVHVHLERAAELGEIEFLGAAAMAGAGIVHQDVNAAVPPDSSIDQVLALVLVADVTGDCLGAVERGSQVV
jgi:hypothetical protein